MDYASLERCKELYELSGWKTGTWHQTSGSLATIVNYGGDVPNEARWSGDDFCPAYSLGYLLRKLPPRIQDENGNWFALHGFPNGIQPWFDYKGNLDGEDARWPIDQGIPFYKRVSQANTPEDALCKLAIELFKQKILTKDGSV